MANVLEFKYASTDSFYVVVIKQQDRKFAFFGDILTSVHCMGQGDMCVIGFYELGYERNDMDVECEASHSGPHGQREEEVGGWVGFQWSMLL